MACKDEMGDVPEDVIEIPENAAFRSRQAKTSNELRIDDELTDFTIISEGKTFRCHSHALASSSDMFLAMFRTAMKESTKRQIELPTVPPNIVKIILEYIYLRTVRVPSDLLLATIKAANFLHLYELKEDCLQQSYQALKPSNVISYHNFAHELDLEELKQRCSTILSSSLTDIAESSEFLSLSLAELIGYFDDIQESDVDNDDKLEALMKWGSQDPSSRGKDMKVLVNKVDLSLCSVQCLDETFKNHSDLLDKEMCMKLAQSLAMIASQSVVRRKRRGRKTIVVIAGHKNTCWGVDESTCMKVTELCKGFECANWYSACKVPKGFVLTGGIGSVLCMMYVVSSQSWVKLTSMRAVRYAHASIHQPHKLLVFGGWVSGQKSTSVQSLQLDGGEWVDEPGLPVAVHYPEVAQIDTTIYLLDLCDTNRLLCLEANARAWKEKATYPGQGGEGPRMLSLNDQLLVAGGRSPQCARYTPSTNTWVMCTPPTLQHYLGALICHNDKIYLMGGRDTEKVEEYELASDRWSVCTWKLPQNVQNLQAVMVDAP